MVPSSMPHADRGREIGNEKKGEHLAVLTRTHARSAAQRLRARSPRPNCRGPHRSQHTVPREPSRLYIHTGGSRPHRTPTGERARQFNPSLGTTGRTSTHTPWLARLCVAYGMHLRGQGKSPHVHTGDTVQPDIMLHSRVPLAKKRVALLVPASAGGRLPHDLKLLSISKCLGHTKPG